MKKEVIILACQTFCEYYIWNGEQEIADRIPVEYPTLAGFGLKTKRFSLACQMLLPNSTTHFKFIELVDGQVWKEIEPEIYWVDAEWDKFGSTIKDRFGRLHKAQGKDYLIPDGKEMRG